MIKGYNAKVLERYEKLRDLQQQELNKRRKEIESVAPEALDIEKAISKAFLNMSLASLRSGGANESVIESTKQKVLDLRHKKAEILASKGYPLDFLDLHYFCTECKDTGYIGITKCSCYMKNLIGFYYRDSDIEEVLRYENFDNFDITHFSNEPFGNYKMSPRENMSKIFDMSQNFVKNFDKSYDNLLFYGNPGSGKTYMSHCIAKALLDNGFLVIYKTADELLNDLRNIKYNRDNDPSVGELKSILLNCDLLIIDDLGTEALTDSAKIEMFNFINEKINKRKKMLISSNFDAAELTRTYSERLSSRLFGQFKLCKFYGDDLRIKLRNN